jgi:hypothetical protein
VAIEGDATRRTKSQTTTTKVTHVRCVHGEGKASLAGPTPPLAEHVEIYHPSLEKQTSYGTDGDELAAVRTID